MFTVWNRERRIREWDSDPLEPRGFDGGPEELKHRRAIVGGNLVGEATTHQPVKVKKELAGLLGGSVGELEGRKEGRTAGKEGKGVNHGTGAR